MVIGFSYCLETAATYTTQGDDTMMVVQMVATLCALQTQFLGYNSSCGVANLNELIHLRNNYIRAGIVECKVTNPVHVVLNKVVLELPQIFWDDSVDCFGAGADERASRNATANGGVNKSPNMVQGQEKIRVQTYSLISLNRGSFDVIVGMDWLSKRKFVIVCHEKVVRIPLEGDEILRVHGERTQGVMKTLVNTKCRLLKREAWSPFEVSVGITEEGEVVTYLRFIANFSKIVKPITSLTERDQKYEWGAERKEAFQTLKNDLFMTIQSNVKDKILATPSETSKVENAPAEMLRDLDQQMEKRADDGKANVVTDALSRKERVKPRRVRAMAMTIQYGVRGMILAAQSEAFKQENALAERLHGLDQQMERKEDENNSKEWNSGDDQLRLRWMIYLVVLADAAESVACSMAEIGESSLTGPELVLDTTNKVVLIKEKLKAEKDRQKSYADKRRKPLEFEILKRIGPVAYRLRLPEELSSVHDTFHVSNLKKCLADANLHVPLNEIKIDKTLRFVEELVEIMDREIRNLKRSKIPLVKVHWNSKRGPKFIWEREDHMKSILSYLLIVLLNRLVKSRDEIP
ncbi:hypothetical protein Tco_1230310 [Tanacetum coccineum]